MDDDLDTDKPFPASTYLSGSDLRHLHDWLEANAKPAKVIARGYTAGDLMGNLVEILDGMWSDGIDAMGEDA